MKISAERLRLPPAEAIIRDAFDNHTQDGLYPYVVRGGNKITLILAIQEALASLPLTKGKKDPQPWKRQTKAIELYYGLEDGRRRSFKEVGKNLGLSKEKARKIVKTGLVQLRRFQTIRDFLRPSPEKMAQLKEGEQRLLEEISQLRKKQEWLERENNRLIRITASFGIKGTRFLAFDQEEEGNEEDEVAFEVFFANLPEDYLKNRVRRSLKRARL
ncbi:MAG: hypothetical protein HYT19_01245, partial [Candidatus Nealsonbacteria bacterium]|nr:hypothetical protein [Candidatus Nealsonbacteria bacterium]